MWLPTLGVMVGWHIITRGVWRWHSSGRSLTGFRPHRRAVTALATARGFFPAFPVSSHVYRRLCVLLIDSVWLIGWTIFRELHSNS